MTVKKMVTKFGNGQMDIYVEKGRMLTIKQDGAMVAKFKFNDLKQIDSYVHELPVDNAIIQMQDTIGGNIAIVIKTPQTTKGSYSKEYTRKGYSYYSKHGWFNIQGSYSHTSTSTSMNTNVLEFGDANQAKAKALFEEESGLKEYNQMQAEKASKWERKEQEEKEAKAKKWREHAQQHGVTVSAQQEKIKEQNKKDQSIFASLFPFLKK